MVTISQGWWLEQAGKSACWNTDFELSHNTSSADHLVIQVTHSGLNYKDALALTAQGRIVRSFPLVPGIDAAGMVSHSHHPEWQVGDQVMLTGWGYGESRHGSLASHMIVEADHGCGCRRNGDGAMAMSIGTAGLTAAQAILALQQHAIDSARGPVIVSGISGVWVYGQQFFYSDLVMRCMVSRGNVIVFVISCRRLGLRRSLIVLIGSLKLHR